MLQTQHRVLGGQDYSSTVIAEWMAKNLLHVLHQQV